MVARFRPSPLPPSGVRFGIALAALALALLGACQPVPRPFQPDSKRLNAADFARLGTRGGIIVRAPNLADPALAAPLTGLLAAALRDADVPAIAGPQDETNRYVLAGDARITRTDGAVVVVSSSWQLIDPRGTPVRSYQVEQRVDGAGWAAGETAALALLAESVAHETAAQFAARPAPRVEPSMPSQRVAIWSIVGLPDDRAASLTVSLGVALRTRGIIVTPLDDPAALVLTGWFDRAAASGGTERISIDWVLLRQNGQELGVVSQSNVVPAGALDRAWADAAPTIAGAAADGIVEMMSQAAGTAARNDGATDSRSVVQ